MLMEADTTTQKPTKSKRNAFTPETSQKAVQAKLKRSKETQAFIDSLKDEAISTDSFKFQEFIKENPTKRKEVIRELLERNLFVRLRYQHSLITSGDPLKKAEARKDDLGIGLEYDKLYKESESEALTIRVPTALAGRISGVLALKIEPVQSVDTRKPIVLPENQNQDVTKPTELLEKSYGENVQE